MLDPDAPKRIHPEFCCPHHRYADKVEHAADEQRTATSKQETPGSMDNADRWAAADISATGAEKGCVHTEANIRVQLVSAGCIK